LIPDSEVQFAKQLGMNTEIQDLRRVIQRAQKRGGKVVVGGHSLGGSMTTASATWDFGGPWLSFGGLPTPFAGLFNSLGAMLVEMAPDAASMAQDLKILPDYLKPPVPATNVAEYGFALDTATSPAALVAAQAHLGMLKTSGDPRGWDDANELTPIHRYADVFSGRG
jgi:hypothetical protein